MQRVRIPLTENAHYVRDGRKSYVHALRKYGITPTTDGPFFVSKQVEHQGKFGGKVGGRVHIRQHGLRKKHHHHAAGSGSGSGSGSGTGSGTGSGSGSGSGSGTAPSSGNGSGTTDGVPVPAEDIQNDSEYLAPVSIGTPAQTLNLDFDTGSADLWVWSTEITSSARSGHTSGHTIFDPTKSSTFKRSTGESWQIQYGDSSTASGDVGTDVVKIGGISIQNQAVELAKQLSDQFLQGAGDGLLGLAWGSINTVQPTPVQTPVENMISQSDIPKGEELFTAWLGASRDSSSAQQNSFYTFGFIDNDALSSINATADGMHYTPVDNSQGFWQFSSESTAVNGTPVAQRGNTAIADTGTTLALVSDAVVKALYAAIPGSKYDSTQQGYLIPSDIDVSTLPTFTVDVGGQSFTIQKEDLLYSDVGNGFTYGGVQSRGEQDFDILGDTFLKSVYAVFDQGNKRFGVVQRTGST